MALTTKQWRLYDFLKENCVGRENAMNGKEIVARLIATYPETFQEGYSTLKKDIHELRNSDEVKRRISSDARVGYWLACKGDVIKDNEYIKNLTYSYITTIVKDGIVSKSTLHRFISRIACERVFDKQGKITFTDTQKPVINVYSDDLKGVDSNEKD